MIMKIREITGRGVLHYFDEISLCRRIWTLQYSIEIIFLIFIVLNCLPGCAQFYADKKPSPITEGAKIVSDGDRMYQHGCISEAIDAYFRAYELFVGYAYDKEAAMTLQKIADAYRAAGDTNGALLFYDAAIASYKSFGKKKDLAGLFCRKAACLLKARRFDEAWDEIQRTRELMGDKADKFVPLLAMQGLYALETGAVKQADDSLTRAQKKVSRSDTAAYATVHALLGSLRLKEKMYDKALKHFMKALSADREGEYLFGIASDMKGIGQALEGKQDFAGAASAYARSLEIFSLINARKEVEKLESLLSGVSVRAGFDTTVTKFFEERWLKGEREYGWCD